MILDLVRVQNVLGIYGKSGDVFPERMSLLQPDTAASFAAVQKSLGMRLRVSDMFRTAEQSLQARATKAGVQRPGSSLHNYGIAIDVDVDSLLTATKLSKPAFDLLMREHGWHCHRKDGKRGAEDWHYNHLGVGNAAAELLRKSERSTNTSAAGDARIMALYGPDFDLIPSQVQAALASLKMYSGEIDGKVGPRSQQSIRAFERAWGLPETGALSSLTLRTLAYVTAQVRVLEPASSPTPVA